MKPAVSQAAVLSKKDEEALEALLVAFDQSWDEHRLAVQLRHLPPATPLRLPALREMVKIDLERQWQRGRRVTIESYLKTYPELGTAATVPVDLLLVEYRVRRQFGAPADLADFARRFPRQAEELRRLAASAPESVVVGSLIGSARATHEGRPSTVSRDDSPEVDVPLPEHFGRYHILRRLGVGAMGAVYLAHDSTLDRDVALKVPHFTAEDGPEARERFQREARAAGALNHPNICRIHDVGVIEGIPYLTMEYLKGRPLTDFIVAGKPIPQRQAAAVVRKLAAALREAHELGIVHRDLKPSNVMINQRKEPVILDFGLARRVSGSDARMTRYGTVLGTPAYMAPEQVKGDVRAVGPRSDIYSLGVILYELLTGRPPFAGDDAVTVMARVVGEEPQRPSQHRPDLDPALEEICLKAMAKKPEDRYPTTGDLATSLSAYLQGENKGTVARETPRPVAPVERTPSEPKTADAGSRRQRMVPRWPAVAAAAAVLGLVLGIILIIKYQQPDGRTGEVNLQVTPDTGRIALELKGFEPGAEIQARVDGNLIDTAHLARPVELRVGRHELQVSAPGYESVVQPFNVQPGDNLPLLVQAVKLREGASLSKVVREVPKPGSTSSPPTGVAELPKKIRPPEPSGAELVGLKCPEAITVKLADNVVLDLVLIRPGSFIMGDKNSTSPLELAHKVRITKPFYLGKYPVTQEQWAAVLKADSRSDPSEFKGAKNPVEGISWEDCQDFLEKLNDKVGKNMGKFRLPTEAEWEYACRAGSTTKYHFGDAEIRLTEYAWYDENSRGKTHPVGQKKPNAWGLHDMHGNVSQWCQDRFGVYLQSEQEDPQGPSEGRCRVIRGGGWDADPHHCRSACRGLMEPRGFRLNNLGCRLAFKRYLPCVW
jgi:serine/threonine protein kinase/formylglycine-generating enzyme required for sulfatase activity